MFQLPSITSPPLGILPLPFGVHLTKIVKGSLNFLVVGQFEKQTFAEGKGWEGAVVQSCIFHSTLYHDTEECIKAQPIISHRTLPLVVV